MLPYNVHSRRQAKAVNGESMVCKIFIIKESYISHILEFCRQNLYTQGSSNHC